MTTKKKGGSPFAVSSDSVLSSFVTEEDVKEGAGEYVPLTAIALPKRQPRRYFDAKKLEELKKSIQQYGILEPLIVRPLENNTYELVAGERRYRAAAELNLEEVPVTVRALNDKEALQIALIENLQREDLNPIEETQGILNLLSVELDLEEDKVKSLLYQMHNGTFDSSHNVMANQAASHNVMANQAEIIQKVFDLLGKMNWESFVKNRLPLLKLPPELLEVLEQGSLEYTKAKEIARIKNDKQRKALLKDAIAQGLSLSQIKERISKIKFAETKGKGGSDNSTKTYASRMKEIYTKTKKMKSWDDPDKQKQFEALLEQIEKLL
ncbi:ParB-like partition protein (plasmid) [Kalymmatonema gypsitolerans NIES-4073]|nr:ParB-like partition protein [Scytonema sp. NIES-4073]